MEVKLTTLEIKLDDLRGAAVLEFLAEHLQGLAEVVPPESRHALNVDGLRARDVTFWSVWCGDQVVGCAALKELDSGHGEIKSMRTSKAHLRKGVATLLLEHIVAQAKQRGYRQLSLETGTQPFFEPAQRLYRKFGFEKCRPFAEYVEDPNTMCMTRDL